MYPLSALSENREFLHTFSIIPEPSPADLWVRSVISHLVSAIPEEKARLCGPNRAMPSILSGGGQFPPKGEFVLVLPLSLFGTIHNTGYGIL